MRKTQFKIFDQPVLMDSSGNFHVKLDTGENLKSISLNGLNAKAKKAKGFDSFPVLRYDRYAGKDKPAFEETHVIGVVRDRGGFNVSYRLANNRFAETVILDTPMNRQRLKKIHRLRLREQDIESHIKGVELLLDKRHPRHSIHTGA